MTRRFHLLLIWLMAFLGVPGAGLSTAADNAGAFDAANKLYEQGKFAEAASAYEKLIQSGPVSAAMYFNLGNAHFKSGHIGRAIATYREVERLTPRDPDIRANLQFARNQVQGPTLRASRWELWLGTLGLNEWAAAAAGAFWSVCLLMTAGQWRPQWQRRLRVYAAMLGGAAVLLFACLGLAWQRHSAETAIVVAPEAVVRAGPFEESQSTFAAHDGAEFQILDHKDDWLQISDGARRTGWLRRNTAQVFGATPTVVSKFQ